MTYANIPNAYDLNVVIESINGTDVRVVEGYLDIVCAVPVTGRMNSAKWDVIILNDGDNEFACQLSKKQVNAWLTNFVVRNMRDAIDAADDAATELENAAAAVAMVAASALAEASATKMEMQLSFF